MAQHDYVIDNASGATVRADINSALSAIQSLNSGTSAPSSTAAGMLWLDTTGGAPYALKVRDAGNNHWLTLASVTDPGSDGNLELLPGKINLPSSGGVFESDGSTEILTESSGAVTLKNTILDSTTTFPSGIINSTSIIKMAFDSNGTQNIDDGSSGITIFTAASDSATGSQNAITTVTGNTYLISFSCFVKVGATGSVSLAERNGRVVLYKGTANMNRGTRSDSFSGTNTELFDSNVGRIATGSQSSERESNVLISMQAAFYESSGGTYYIFAAGAGSSNNVRMTTNTSSGNPAYLTFMEIKGNKISELT